MKVLVQAVNTGEVRLVETTTPSPSGAEVCVRATRSVLSAGTERAVRQLASASLLGKARQRPDLVRQVAAKAMAEGLRPTIKAVRSRLDDDMPLGYSAAGVVMQVGEAVPHLAPGQRVAVGGAGHADLQVVAANLAVPIPDDVSDEEAAFATIAAIALQGLRLAELGPGSKVCIIGLGLIGQLTARIATASGYDVVGIDVSPWNIDRLGANGLGLVEAGNDTTEAVTAWSRGRGADAVLITAASESSAPLQRAPALARDRGTIVVVGDVGMELQRTPLYEKELTVRVARSYGPGRYDRSYEDWGVDYPPGLVRWSAGRNMEAFLDLLASGRMSVADLITHRFPFDRAADAYALLESRSEPYLGIELEYGSEPPAPLTSVRLSPRNNAGDGVALLGAGNYVRATMLGSLKAAGFERLVSISSANGISARRVAEKAGFEKVVSSIEQVIDDPDVTAVLVATPHSTHAELSARALDAGKHVFCEKPLALSQDELDLVIEAWHNSGKHLVVGFNRRHSPAVGAVTRAFGATGGPLAITYRVNAGSLPSKHWYHDRAEGGRLLGEVCHFIDTCSAIVGSSPDRVYCVGSMADEALLTQDAIVTMRYGGGSIATVVYAASGHPGTAKERVEVMGRGHTALIDDFHSCVFDGKVIWKGTQDKGHTEVLRKFKAVLGSSEMSPLTVTGLESSAATLAAARSLLSGEDQRLPRY
jgi:predicted dehydrogenase/threonine dehydrogenase-like Zn-dependent dehydrogenase